MATKPSPISVQLRAKGKQYWIRLLLFVIVGALLGEWIGEKNL